MTNSSQKILFLESLRGIAAISVALHHANFAHQSVLVDNLFIKNAHHMVDFFFVLSGYVISFNYFDRISSFTGLLNFQGKRFLRLYPLHFLTLMVFLAIEVCKYVFQEKTGIVANSPPFSVNGLGAFLNNVFLTHSMFESSLTFNSVSWSISTEFYTYLIFACMLATVRGTRWKHMATIGVILGAASYLFLYQAGNETAANGSAAIARCLYSFFLGVGIFLLGRFYKKSLPGRFGLLLLVVSLVAVCYHESVPPLALPLFFAAALFFLIHSDQNRVKSLLSHRYLVFFGTISYGIYMWHLMMWWIIDQFFRFGLKYPTVSDQLGQHPVLEPLTATLAVVVGTLIVVALSWISYRYVEKPFNGLRHSLPKLRLLWHFRAKA